MATTTIYSTIDGQVGHNQNGQTFATHRAAAGNAVDYTATTMNFSLEPGTTPNFNGMYRAIALFDVSALAGTTITALTLSFYVTSLTDGMAQSMGLVSLTTTSDTSLVAGDYDVGNWTMARLASDIDITSLSTSVYNDFTLNSTGIALFQAAADGSGIAHVGITFSGDIDNSAPTWSATLCQVIMSTSEATGTSQDPKAFITYSTPSGPVGIKSWNGLTVR
jgi:hypothetical protein